MACAACNWRGQQVVDGQGSICQECDGTSHVQQLEFTRRLFTSDRFVQYCTWSDTTGTQTWSNVASQGVAQ